MTLSKVQISVGRCAITAGELIWLADQDEGRWRAGVVTQMDSRDLAKLGKPGHNWVGQIERLETP